MKHSKHLIVLDLETTGVWVEKDKIVEIALIKTSADGEKETYLKRVNPGIPLPPFVSKIIGITDADLKDAPFFRQIAAEVMNFLGDSDLAGFNLERFDLPLLERELAEAGHKFDYHARAVYDAQKVYHLNEKRDLTTAYKFYCNRELINAHSAMADAQATLDILCAQVSKYGNGNDALDSLNIFNYREIADFYGRTRKFRWWNGELYPLFGKYAKKLSLQDIARKDPDYLKWIASADFPEEVKDLAEDALKGQFPSFEQAVKK